MMKQAVWIVVVVVIVGGLAAPKLLPLLKGGSDKQQSATAGSDKTSPDKKGSGNQQKKSASSDAKSSTGAALKVSTFVVKPAPFVETVSATGSLRAEESVDLQAETNGKIVAINFTEGTRVRKGDLLLKLNDADLRANLDRYSYSKQLAELRERRYAKLLGQKVVTQDDYDTALSDVNVQQAFIDLYKAQIAETEIRAPFDGVVGLRYVSMGAFVNATTRIATLQRLDKLKIDFSVPEKYTGRVVVGSPISFTVAGGAHKFKGEIYAIDPRIDSGTRTLLIRAVCPNVDGRVLPGAFANIQFTLSELQDALLIPSEAVIPGLDEKNVFVMNNGIAERRAVETGTRTATTVHILAGLSPGELVITSGLQQLRAGQAVAQLDAAPKQSKDSKDTSGSGDSTRTTSNVLPAVAVNTR